MPRKVRFNKAQESCMSEVPNANGHFIKLPEVLQLVNLGLADCLPLASEFFFSFISNLLSHLVKYGIYFWISWEMLDKIWCYFLSFDLYASRQKWEIFAVIFLFDLYASSQIDICCLRQSKSIKKSLSSISGESFFVDGVFSNQAWSSHHNQSNQNLSNIQPKKRLV